ncbi:hypothetical protein F5148DRAFT_495250 [Russula earlei]|uniref:Uncharacterized protein n=1 Tax=Russula earlei TaxID=71964 RepID=A0ACC0TYR0_9AGAM|nr:hypothetical protein F5148DRAFT_495250 [Russula earlei]
MHTPLHAISVAAATVTPRLTPPTPAPSPQHAAAHDNFECTTDTFFAIDFQQFTHHRLIFRHHHFFLHDGGPPRFGNTNSNDRRAIPTAHASSIVAIASPSPTLTPLSLPTPQHKQSPPPRQFRRAKPQNIRIKTLDQEWSKFQAPGRCKVSHIAGLGTTCGPHVTHDPHSHTSLLPCVSSPALATPQATISRSNPHRPAIATDHACTPRPGSLDASASQAFHDHLDHCDQS